MFQRIIWDFNIKLVKNNANFTVGSFQNLPVQKPRVSNSLSCFPVTFCSSKPSPKPYLEPLQTVFCTDYAVTKHEDEMRI